MLHFGWPFFIMVTYSHFCHSIGSLLWLFRASLYESWVSIRWDPQSEQTQFRHFAAIPSSGRYEQTVMSDNFCFDMSLKMLNSAMLHLVANFFKPSTLSETLQHWVHRQVLRLVSDTLWTCLGFKFLKEVNETFWSGCCFLYTEKASDNIITIRCFWTFNFFSFLICYLHHLFLVWHLSADLHREEEFWHFRLHIIWNSIRPMLPLFLTRLPPIRFWFEAVADIEVPS